MDGSVWRVYMLEAYAPSADEYAVYVGITSRPVLRRVAEHMKPLSSPRGLFRDLEREEQRSSDGWGGGLIHSHQVLAVCPGEREARRLERLFIFLAKEEHGRRCLNQA